MNSLEKTKASWTTRTPRQLVVPTELWNDRFYVQLPDALRPG